MSDVPQGPGWWQANNDKWYPPESAPGPRPAPAPITPPIAPPTQPSQPQPGTPPYGQHQPAPAARNTATLAAIIGGAAFLGVAALAVLAILAVTFLGRKSTSKFVSVGGAYSNPPITEPATGAASVAGQPCVAPVGPFPPNAPAVPVQTGPPPTALVVKDLKEGTGAVVKPNDTVTANYIGVSCSTGKVFDASYLTGKPVAFPLNQVIAGWTEGIPGMKVGGQRLLGIPPDLAYGDHSPAAEIAPGETLWFVVEVTATSP